MMEQTRKRVQQLQEQLHAAHNYGCALRDATHALDFELKRSGRQLGGTLSLNTRGGWHAHCEQPHNR